MVCQELRRLPLILFLPLVHLTMSQVLINTHRISVSLGHSMWGWCTSVSHAGRKEGTTYSRFRSSVVTYPRFMSLLIFSVVGGRDCRGMMIIMTLMMRSLNPLLSKQTPQPLCTVQQRLSRHHHQNNSFPRMIIIIKKPPSTTCPNDDRGELLLLLLSHTSCYLVATVVVVVVRAT